MARASGENKGKKRRKRSNNHLNQSGNQGNGGRAVVERQNDSAHVIRFILDHLGFHTKWLCAVVLVPGFHWVLGRIFGADTWWVEPLYHFFLFIIVLAWVVDALWWTVDYFRK